MRIVPRIQPAHWLMAGVALAAHAGLLVALGATGEVSVPHGAGPVLQVALLAPLTAPAATSPDGAADIGHASAGAVIAAATPATAALPVAGIEAAHYFLPQELSEKPQVVHDVAPDLSYLQLPAGPVQSAVLRLMINESGDIDQVTLSRSELPEAVAEAVVKAYANLKFSPGKIGEQNVKSQILIEVRLENTAVL